MHKIGFRFGLRSKPRWEAYKGKEGGRGMGGKGNGKGRGGEVRRGERERIKGASPPNILA